MSFPLLPCFKLSLYVIVAMPPIKHLIIFCCVLFYNDLMFNIIFFGILFLYKIYSYQMINYKLSIASNTDSNSVSVEYLLLKLSSSDFARLSNV